MAEIRGCLVSAGVAGSVGLTGDIRIGLRSQGSTKEDVVISSLALTDGQIQEGVFNVNIHVPNLVGQQANNPMQVDNTQPNLDRMEQIAQACVQALNETYLFDSLIDLDGTGLVVRDGTGWFLNICVHYYSSDF